MVMARPFSTVGCSSARGLSIAVGHPPVHAGGLQLSKGSELLSNLARSPGRCAELPAVPAVLPALPADGMHVCLHVCMHVQSVLLPGVRVQPARSSLAVLPKLMGSGQLSQCCHSILAWRCSAQWWRDAGPGRCSWQPRRWGAAVPLVEDRRMRGRRKPALGSNIVAAFGVTGWPLFLPALAVACASSSCLSAPSAQSASWQGKTSVCLCHNPLAQHDAPRVIPVA